MAGVNASAWKGDNYKFVGKAFDYAYADRMNKLSPIVGEVNSNSIDYELMGSGGYGELMPYDGANLNMGRQVRGFKTIITPQEFTLSDRVGFKQAKVDKLGETRKVGTRLGDTTAMTVYAHTLRVFHNAYNPNFTGGDAKPWAAEDHPNASMMGENRRYIADAEAGSFSNLIKKALTVEAITEAQSMSGRFVTPDGLPFMCDMDTILVPPELEATAKKLFGENARLTPKLNPDDDTNAANPVYGMSYIVVGGGHDGLTGKQWALCDRRLMKQMLNLVYITRPRVMNTELDNPLLDLYTAYVDFGIGWGDARQIIFSAGV